MNLIQNHENPNLLERGVGKNFTLELFWLEFYGRFPYFHFHFLHVHKKVLGGLNFNFNLFFISCNLKRMYATCLKTCSIAIFKHFKDATNFYLILDTRK